jgi:hypothetical protein
MKPTTKSAKLLLRSLLVLALLSIGVLEAKAGDKERRGTAGAAELLVPVTAQYSALGSAMTSGLNSANGLEMLFANPAGLTLNTGTAAMFSRMEYVADIGVNFLGLGQRFGNNQLAFTVTSWDFGDIPLQTETRPEISSVTFDASFIIAGLSYARQFTDRIAAGLTLKVVNETIDDMSATAVAFDAGMTYAVGESGLRLGVSLKNIGSDLTYSGTGLIRTQRIPNQPPSASGNSLVIESEGVQLPSLLNFGLSYAREVGAGAVVTVLGNYRSNSFDQDQYAGALEVGLFNVLYLRGGFEIVPDQDLSFFNGSNFGAGLNLEFGGTQLTVDYAYRPADFFDDVQMFTVGVTL